MFQIQRTKELKPIIFVVKFKVLEHGWKGFLFYSHHGYLVTVGPLRLICLDWILQKITAGYETDSWENCWRVVCLSPPFPWRTRRLCIAVWIYDRQVLAWYVETLQSWWEPFRTHKGDQRSSRDVIVGWIPSPKGLNFKFDSITALMGGFTFRTRRRVWSTRTDYRNNRHWTEITGTNSTESSAITSPFMVR